MNRFEIRDEKGLIHSGTEEEMNIAWLVMTCPERLLLKKYDYTKEQIKDLEEKWYCEWEGDLELLQLIDVYR